MAGNYCTQKGTCAASGVQPAGGTCSGEGDCASGLTCALTGLTGVCQAPGTGDLQRSCLQTSDCLAGLLCLRGQCTKAYMSPPSPLACSPDEATARILFHVPRLGDPPTNPDFYRLPFPNDIRSKGGLLSLTGHPRPGATFLPFDIVDRYIKAIEAEVAGFGANPTLYVRFSRAIDVTRFPADCAATLVDITPTSPTYGLNQGLTCNAAIQSTSYVCGPYMAVRPSLGSPLRPGTTYALLVRKDADPSRNIVDTLGSSFGPDDDFLAMLEATPPVDAELVAAHAAYQPLRDYIAAGKAVATALASAAVFTVQSYEDPMAGIAAAIALAPPPQIDSLVRCGDPAAVNPCDDLKLGAAHVRGCLAADTASANFTTYQGTISLPVLQKGVRPYLSPETDGGGIDYAGGVATIQGFEKVCFSLTVPTGTPPATGWPLVVYGHGTGGSYRSIVDLGLSDDFARGDAPAGLGLGVDGGVSAASLPMAVLGFDGVMHGTRNGGSSKPVGELFYNFLNPAAARDNALQAAADLLAIPRSLASFAEQHIALDGKRLSLYGHSQGGNAASLVAARESPYGAIVMSGTGGTLIYTLLGKTQPINVPAVLPFLLGETSAAAVGADHPVLSLIQTYFERADSVNFGRRLFKEPLAAMTPHHILHVYGLADSYSVVPTERAYGLAAQFKVGQPVVDDPYGLDPIPTAPPYSNNEFFGRYGKLTALQIQYQPDGTYDGHFVSTSHPHARAAIQQMLVTAARDGVPTVTP
jgi:predicted esterase